MSQHMDALAVANRTRLDRAALRAEVHQAAGDGEGQLARGLASLAGMLADERPCLYTARLWDVLSWPPKVQCKIKRRILRHIGVVYEYRTVGELTARQLEQLVSVLRSPALLDHVDDEAEAA